MHVIFGWILLLCVLFCCWYITNVANFSFLLWVIFSCANTPILQIKFYWFWCLFDELDFIRVRFMAYLQQVINENNRTKHLIRTNIQIKEKQLITYRLNGSFFFYIVVIVSFILSFSLFWNFKHVKFFFWYFSGRSLHFRYCSMCQTNHSKSI